MIPDCECWEHEDDSWWIDFDRGTWIYWEKDHMKYCCICGKSGKPAKEERMD